MNGQNLQLFVLPYTAGDNVTGTWYSCSNARAGDYWIISMGLRRSKSRKNPSVRIEETLNNNLDPIHSTNKKLVTTLCSDRRWLELAIVLGVYHQWTTFKVLPTRSTFLVGVNDRNCQYQELTAGVPNTKSRQLATGIRFD